MFVTPNQVTFNSGQLSPLSSSRKDQEYYYSGAAELVNFDITLQGPISKRGGTLNYGQTQNGRAFTVPFVFDNRNSYILEFGHHYLRFWFDDGLLSYANGAPYTLATPWQLSDLGISNRPDVLALRCTQSNDIMWITHGEGRFPRYELTRRGTLDWTLQLSETRNGPFEDIDPNNSVLVWTEQGRVFKGGQLTVRSNTPIFTPNTVGRSIYIEPTNIQYYAPWESDAQKGWTIARYNGNVYKIPDGYVFYNKGRTGVTPPTHLDGVANDGGLDWEYYHSNKAWGDIIAASADGYSCTVLAATTFFESLGATQSRGGNKRWAFGVFHSPNNHPIDTTLYDKRLCLIKGNKIAFSRSDVLNDFNRFEGQSQTSETGLYFSLNVTGSVLGRWAEATSAGVVIGTADNIVAVNQRTKNQVFGFSNAKASRQSRVGTSYIKAITVEEGLFHVDPSYKALHAINYDGSSDTFISEDMTILSEDILEAGVTSITYAARPNNTIWCSLTDGTLASLTYNRQRKVIGWAKHKIEGAFVNSVASKPSNREDIDVLWMSVQTSTGFYIYRMHSNLPDETMVYLDSATEYSGPPTRIFTNLDYLEGQTVTVFYDNRVVGDYEVSGGKVEINQDLPYALIGLRYEALLKTLPADAAGTGQGNTSEGMERSTTEINLNIYKSYGGYVSTDGVRFVQVPYMTGGTVIGARPQLFTGLKQITTHPYSDKEGCLYVKSDAPFPFTLRSISPTMFATRLALNYRQ
jgi:hypothetical protein